MTLVLPALFPVSIIWLFGMYTTWWEMIKSIPSILIIINPWTNRVPYLLLDILRNCHQIFQSFVPDFFCSDQSWLNGRSIMRCPSHHLLQSLLPELSSISAKVVACRYNLHSFEALSSFGFVEWRAIVFHQKHIYPYFKFKFVVCGWKKKSYILKRITSAF